MNEASKDFDDLMRECDVLADDIVQQYGQGVATRDFVHRQVVACWHLSLYYQSEIYLRMGMLLHALQQRGWTISPTFLMEDVTNG